MVLRARDAARRSASLEVLRHEDRPRAVHAAYRLHRPDNPARRDAARKHRIALARLPPGVTHRALKAPLPRGRVALWLHSRLSCSHTHPWGWLLGLRGHVDCFATIPHAE